MNTSTAATLQVNWNGRKAKGPTCACGKRDYCDNSCNTFRKPVRNVYPMPAEDESFADWQDRRTSGGR